MKTSFHPPGKPSAQAAATWPRRRIWKWVGVAAIIAVLGLGVVVTIVLRHAGPILKGRVVETLRTRFSSKVELDTLEVSIFRGLEVSGQGLRIYPPDDVVAAGATHPLFNVQHFSFHTGLRELFIKPMRVKAVEVTGLAIRIPPREYRGGGGDASQKRQRGKIEIAVDHILCEGCQLVIDTAKPGKDPKVFALRHIDLRDFGPNSAWPYDATLTNPTPQGDIHAAGSFGPWNTESPGDSPVNGHYTFDHVDLNTIRGIGGMLSSVGDFHGQLNRMEVDGTAGTPNFSLDTANLPVPLETRFHAIVDGTTGDTYLQPVNARLGSSQFTCSGAVVNVQGQGHFIDLDIDIPQGQIADFLRLAVKTRPTVLTGVIATQMKLHIAPGNQSVTRKLAVRGNFTLNNLHFSSTKVQDQVDMLSLRAQGHPEQAQPGAPAVSSGMSGALNLHGGRIDFSRIDYTMPGATVHLTGVYTLDGQTFDFTGQVRTQAKLSQMVSTWWKSLLLKGADPFFHKDGAGALIPVKITGTENAPKFGLDIDHLDLGNKDKK
jgi:hypothetical protein